MQKQPEKQQHKKAELKRGSCKHAREVSKLEGGWRGGRSAPDAPGPLCFSTGLVRMAQRLKYNVKTRTT